MPDLIELRHILESAHSEQIGTTDDLLIGLQLTHSGRFARPSDKKKMEPRVAYRHPILDARFGVNTDDAILSDDDLKRLIEDFIAASKLAQKAGYRWVDIKHCHGYLGHECFPALIVGRFWRQLWRTERVFFATSFRASRGSAGTWHWSASQCV